MEQRVKLKRGVQREIILSVSKKEGSIRKLAIKIHIPYSTLKNYVTEDRLLPKNLFFNLLKLYKGAKENLKISYLNSNWGQSIGG